MTVITHEFTKDEDPPGIPHIADSELLRLSGEFELLCEVDGGYRVVDLCPRGADNQMAILRNMSCIWEPFLGRSVTIQGEAKAVPFFVSCGYHAFFKPSVAEILSQAPCDDLLELGYNAYFIGPHIEILRSGQYQKATAFFVRASLPR